VEYSEYLPHINVLDGKARVMNNLKLYASLLGKFKGRQMVDDLLAAVKAGDETKAVQHAHALRGTAANLGFTVVHDVTHKIEAMCKSHGDCSALCDELDDSMTALEEAINTFIDAQAAG